MGCHTFFYKKSHHTIAEISAMNLNPETTVYIPEKGLYIECDKEYHDLFRIYGYPNDALFSYAETLEYIKKYEKENNTIVPLLMNDDTGKTYLEEFWEKYPDGMINFE